ncbi:MAG: Hsp20/alpha crystallin family protein [Acidobacteria bacterium]|jgi:HSP20 family protein|nr:Hsp20/alpha crystallin family protein [Acidobacteriota bacterium]MCU0253124.1 Hsp20/alpha crystallin family protein [Acidobacteriota bacterium]
MQQLVELKARINRVLEEALARGDEGVEAEAPGGSGEWTPRIDLYEYPDRLVLKADVPGVVPADLEVRIDPGELTIRGVRRPPADLDPAGARRLERPFGPFVRRYSLPESVDPERARATYQLGVLEVVVGRRDEQAGRRVPVQAD